MRRIKGILLFISILGYLPFLTAQTVFKQKLSIEQMFQLADSNSRSIRTFHIGEQEAEQAVKVAKTANLPSVDVSISASYLGDA